MMVLMALVTTFMTNPLLQAICPDKMFRREAEKSSRQLAVTPLGLDPAGD
jgi:hypothetical protein